MARYRMGRDARLYVSDESFDAADLVVVARGKDITVTDEANEVTASARDVEYDISDVGSKTFSIEIELNEEASAPVADSGRDLVRDAYVNGTELFVVLCKAPKDVASGEAIKFKGKVFSHGYNAPEGDTATIPVSIKPSDPDNVPTRVTTPLA